MRARLEAWWTQIPARYRKYLVIVAAGAVVTGILYLAVSRTPEKRPVRTGKPPREIFIQRGLEGKFGIPGLAWELEQIQKHNRDLQSKLDRLMERMEKAKTTPLDTDWLRAEIEHQTQQQVQEQMKRFMAQQEKKPEKPGEPEKPRATGGSEGPEWWREFEQGRTGGAVDWRQGRKPEPAAAPADFKSGARRAREIKVITAESGGKEQAAKEKKKSKDQDKSTFLPAGSIFSGTLLTGMDVACGQSAKKDPFPVLLRVKKEAILPNRFSADVRECFLIAAGWGDLSSERAYLRGERLSCVREDGKALETRINMYAVGEDGKAGVRGRLVSKQGAILGKALMAGFMEGFSRLFGRQPIMLLGTGSYGRDTVTPFQRNLSREALEAGALEGVGSALNRLSNYYIDMAENIFPVVEIDAGRAIDFVLIRGVSLQLEGKS